MKILGIETSCDETGAAIIEGQSRNKKVKILSNIVTSSLSLHKKTGGIIPEVAAREQIKYIIPVINQAIEQYDNLRANKQNSIVSDIDAIAVTTGPGLIGSLLIGVETAKTLSFIWKKPIIAVNHLIGHVYTNFIQQSDCEIQTKSLNNKPLTVNESTFPAISLIVSGGHTDLILIRNHGSIKWLGGTRDDAAGEAFDKIGRLLNLPYPGGPSIEKEALKGDPKAFNFPRPLIDSNDYDFSFSGLKTAVYRETKIIKRFNNRLTANISASVQQAIVDVLVKKTLKAVLRYNAKSILLGGGVAANQKLRDELMLNTKNQIPNTEILIPEKSLCTDNAAMIASAAFFNYKPASWKKIIANPELYFD